MIMFWALAEEMSNQIKKLEFLNKGNKIHLKYCKIVTGQLVYIYC